MRSPGPLAGPQLAIGRELGRERESAHPRRYSRASVKFSICIHSVARDSGVCVCLRYLCLCLCNVAANRTAAGISHVPRALCSQQAEAMLRCLVKSGMNARAPNLPPLTGCHSQGRTHCSGTAPAIADWRGPRSRAYRKPNLARLDAGRSVAALATPRHATTTNKRCMDVSVTRRCLRCTFCSTLPRCLSRC